MKAKSSQILPLLSKELSKHQPKILKNDKKNKKYASVSAIFRVNPHYNTPSLLQVAEKYYKPIKINQKPQENMIKPKYIEEILLNISDQKQKIQNQEFSSQTKNFQQQEIHDYYQITNENYKPQELIDKKLTTQIKDEIQDEKDQQIQLLFIQRATNPQDRHSGQLAFPGGHVDANENDFQAVIREIHEEIGLDFQSQNNPDFYQFYMGKAPSELYARINKNGQQLFVTVHMFLLVQKNKQNLKFYISEAELQTLKFVDFIDFIYPKENQIHFLQFGGVKYIMEFLPSYFKKVVNNWLKDLKYNLYPAINVEMNAPLWGLTYTLLNITLQMIYVKNLQIQNSYDLSQMKKFIDIPLQKSVWKTKSQLNDFKEILLKHYNQRHQTSLYQPYQKLQQNYGLYIALSLFGIAYFLPNPSL